MKKTTLQKSYLLPLAVLPLFAIYLCSPSFVHTANTNQGHTYMSGWQHDYLFADCLVHLPSLNRAEAITAVCIALPVLLAEAGFCILPLLHLKKFFGRPWLQFFLAGIFLAGCIGFGWLVIYGFRMKYGVGQGVFFWLMAVGCAFVYCLLPFRAAGQHDNR